MSYLDDATEPAILAWLEANSWPLQTPERIEACFMAVSPTVAGGRTRRKVSKSAYHTVRRHWDRLEKGRSR